jgi:hypothetical protein
MGHLNDVHIPELKNPEVTLLIGTDVPEAHWKLEERRGRKKEPYAIRTPLGWSVAGPMGTTSGSEFSAFFVRGEDEFDRTVEMMFEIDSSESAYGQSLGKSLEDKKALSIMEKSLKVVDSHYQLDLPFRDKLGFPNNRCLAERKLHSLKARLKKDADLHEKYKKGINNNVEKGYASKIHESEGNDIQAEERNVWYLPHHPVLHPQKPQKQRIVFDCTAKYEDMSLNDRLLQGPDLTNKLIGVLSRFRQDPTAFTADIEAMFCQVKVSPIHRDFLKFLWWKDGDYNQPVEVYRMSVHPFGATSSPSCAGFCLHKTADEFESEFDPETIETIHRNFYVDDCLKSVSDTQKAIRLIQQLRDILMRRSFRLTKFVSNDVAVLA